MPRRNRGPHLFWRKDRGAWFIRWYEHGRRRSRSTGTGESGEAEQKLARFILDSVAAPSGPTDPSKRLIASILDDYIREHGEAVARPGNIAFAVKRLLLWWRDLPVLEVREGTCRAYVASRAPAKPGSTRNELAYLQAAIRHDWRAGRLTREMPVWLPPRPEPRDRWLTRDEAAGMIRAARQAGLRHLALFMLLGLYTGGRHEALLSLRWPQIDLDTGLIDFNPPGRARTSKGRPIIPAPRKLLAVLRRARKRGSATGYVVTWQGHPIRDVGRSFAAAVRVAGLPGKVTPHTLRHTAASWMVQRGVSLENVARYLGNTVGVVERTYSHMAPEHLKPARDALDRRA